MPDIRHMMAALALALAAGGCARGPGQINGGQATLPADDGSAGYLDRVSSVPTVSENDAARGILLLLEADDAGHTFAQRIETLRQRGVVGASWDMDANRPVTRGRLAYMIYTACDLRGGVINELAGPTRRYCLRELVFLGMMPEGSAAGRVSGMEMVAALTRADVYRREGKLPDYLSKAGRQ
jgi:hypothetical protein